MTPQLKVVYGHNNYGTLATLYEIDATEFKRYMVGDPKTEWHGYETRINSADRQAKNVGMPWFVWIMQGMSIAGTKILRDAICPGASAEVTVITYNKDENAYLPYNATLIWPTEDDRAWVFGGWSNTRLTFINAVLYSGFNTGFSPTGFGV